MRSDTAMKADGDRMDAEDDAMKAEAAMAATEGHQIVKVVESRLRPRDRRRQGRGVLPLRQGADQETECYGDCADAWPPVLTKGKPRAGKGAKRACSGRPSRRNGKLQVTYAGHPLYYYVDDSPARSSARTSTSSAASGWS